EGIYPDGQFTLVECDKQNLQGANHVDLWKLKLDGTGYVKRLTHFSDYPGIRLPIRSSVTMANSSTFKWLTPATPPAWATGSLCMILKGRLHRRNEISGNEECQMTRSAYTVVALISQRTIAATLC